MRFSQSVSTNPRRTAGRKLKPSAFHTSILWFRMRKRKLYLGAIRHGRLTKNQVSLKSKSSSRQSLSGVLQANFATDKSHLRISTHVGRRQSNRTGVVLSAYALPRAQRAYGFLFAECCNLSRDLACRLCAIFWEPRTPRGSRAVFAPCHSNAPAI